VHAHCALPAARRGMKQGWKIYVMFIAAAAATAAQMDGN